MTKAIRSYGKAEQAAVITRRIKGNTGGLGYISAVAAQARIAGKAKAESLAAEIERKEAEQAGKE